MRSLLRRDVSKLWRSARGLIREAVARRGGLGLSRRAAPLDELALVLREPHVPAEARAAVVYLAKRLSGAKRVELMLPEESGHPPRRAACWPSPPPEGIAEATDGPDEALVVPLRFDGKLVGTLRLIPERPGQAWSEGAIRRLSTFGTLAAATSLRSPRSIAAEAIRDPLTGAHNAAFLAAYLTQAVAQARRRHEPLAVVCAGLDDWERSRARHNPALVEAVLQRAARAMAGTLRSSDVVARLDDARLVAVLPGAALGSARLLAESLRAAITEAGLASGLTPPPAASLGLATFPDHAKEPGPLLAAAREALARAQSVGQGQIVAAPPLGGAGASAILHRVG